MSHLLGCHRIWFGHILFVECYIQTGYWHCFVNIFPIFFGFWFCGRLKFKKEMSSTWALACDVTCSFMIDWPTDNSSNAVTQTTTNCSEVSGFVPEHPENFCKNLKQYLPSRNNGGCDILSVLPSCHRIKLNSYPICRSNTSVLYMFIVSCFLFQLIWKCFDFWLFLCPEQNFIRSRVLSNIAPEYWLFRWQRHLSLCFVHTASSLAVLSDSSLKHSCCNVIWLRVISVRIVRHMSVCMPLCCCYWRFKGPWTPKLTYHFLKRAQFSQNFDSNISTQCFVNTKKLAFKIDDLWKWYRKQVAMMAPGDVTSLAQRHHEY